MRVGIVGAGAVGSAAGFAMVLSGVATDIVFVDINVPLARAQAEDIAKAKMPDLTAANLDAAVRTIADFIHRLDRYPRRRGNF